ncbi:MAG: hypothetical protein JO287_23845 [Pseudonocardiales bacterium]|nr:hypothetical protein [Pseudonocardiales bacterium]
MGQLTRGRSYRGSGPNARFTDLGSDFYDKRIDPERRKRAHIHQLEALGYKVTIELAT